MEKPRRGIRYVPEDYTFTEGCIAWGIVGIGGIAGMTLLILGVM